MSNQTKAKPSEAFEALRRELDAVTESMDTSWCDNLCDYSYLISDEHDELIKAFRENYSSRKIGFQEFDHLGGDELTDALLKVVEEGSLASLILQASEAETCDIYIQWNEMASVSIGEMECQVDVTTDSELAALVDACTEAELKSLGYRSSYGHQSYGYFITYGHPCDRIVWKLDPEIFLESVNGYLKQAGLVDPDTAAATTAATEAK